MSNTQQVEAPNPVNKSPVLSRRDYAFFSSGAITFLAMMEMLAAEQKAMNGMANLAVITTNSRKDAIETTASATQSMYNDDATSLTQQSNEQWGNVASSFGSVGSNFAGLGITKIAANHAERVEALHSEAINFKPKNPSQGANGVVLGSSTTSGQGPVPSARPFSEPEREMIRAHSDQLRNGGFSQKEYKQIVARPKGAKANYSAFDEFDLRTLDPKNEGKVLDNQKITLRDVFEQSGTEAPRNPDDLAQLTAGIGKGKTLAHEAVKEANDSANRWTGIGSSTAQAATGMAASQFKRAEAQANRDKGADSMTQSLSQNNAQLAQETAKSQSDQSEKFNNLSGQVWQSINQLVQVDTRG